MAPDKIRLEVVNAVGVVLSGARVKVLVRRGVEWREEKGEAVAPVTHALRSGFGVIEVDATVADHVAERGLLTFGYGTMRWESTNPAWSLREEEGTAILRIVLGRIRFAPVVELSDDMMVTPPFNPNAVLVTGNNYRTVGLRAEVVFRTLRKPAIGRADASDWDRFSWDEQKINLADRGNWLLLEYGDSSPRLDALRHLVGVWAPHSIAGNVPAVVVQITPNTRQFYYPVDKLPFTGLYPYGCIPAPNRPPEAGGKYRLRDCRQSYAELPSNRSLGQYKIVYQLYAARPEVFAGPNGPIVITPSPALLAPGGVMRDPFMHREGMGRLVAEVLRFLWSRKLTLPRTLGSVHLRMRAPAVEVWGNRPAVPPMGFPDKALTTVVCHSAGVKPTLTLAGHTPEAQFPTQFPRALFGGMNGYCEQMWTTLWVVDGIENPGHIGEPSPGSSAAATWLQWLRARSDQTRRWVGVYTPTGLSGGLSPELLQLTQRPAKGKAGWIEEGQNPRVSWLRTSYEYLEAAPTSDAALPKFEPLPIKGDPTRSNRVHNKVYEFGVGYAARFSSWT